MVCLAEIRHPHYVIEAGKKELPSLIALGARATKRFACGKKMMSHTLLVHDVLCLGIYWFDGQRGH